MARKPKRRVTTGFGGNFRQPTPAAAAQYIKRWERIKDAAGQPVNNVNQMKVGIGGLKDDKAVTLAKIRFTEALRVIKYFEEKSKAFEVAKAQFDENMKQWKDCKKQGIKPEDCALSEAPKRPAKPTGESKAADKRRAGNFKPMTKTQAKNYLHRFYRALRASVSDFVPGEDGTFAALEKFKRGAKAMKVGPRGSAGNFVARVREAMEIVGVADAVKIAHRAKELAVEDALAKIEKLTAKLSKNEANLTAAEEKAAKKAEGAKARLLKAKEKLQSEKSKLDAYLAAVRRRRAKRSMRRR